MPDKPQFTLKWLLVEVAVLLGHQGEFTTTTTAKFAENGNEEWSIITTNQKNEVIGKFTGTNQRRKK